MLGKTDGAMGRRGEGAAAALAVVLLFLCVSACVKRGAPAAAQFVPPDVIFHKQAIEAFEEFTPDGYARAARAFDQAAELAPDNCGYLLHRSQALLFLALEQKLNWENFQPTWDEAIATLGKAATPNRDARESTARACSSTDPFALRLEALGSLDDFGPGKDRAALAKISQAIEMEPANPLNWYVRWKLNPTTARQENAIVKAAELSPDLALVQYELGNYWLVKAEYENARQAFERALERSPKHFRSYIGLAQAIAAIDDTENVEHLYRKAVELAAGFLEGRILLGDYYAGLEESELAAEQYQAVVALNPEYEVAYLRLGLTQLQAGRLDEAEQSFREAIALNPSSFEAHYYLGNIAFARGSLDRARELYEESLKFVLNFPEAVYALGTVFVREGQTDRALEQFERVLRINRGHADAHFSRASIRVQRRQFSAAIEDYNRALFLYDQQLSSAVKSIEHAEERGLTRKVEAERKRKGRLEGLIERARQLKMRAEDESLKSP